MMTICPPNTHTHTHTHTHPSKNLFQGASFTIIYMAAAVIIRGGVQDLYAI